MQTRSPSVARGDRSSSRAPALPATPRASSVLPVPGAPYSSTARAHGVLQHIAREDDSRVVCPALLRVASPQRPSPCGFLHTR